MKKFRLPANLKSLMSSPLFSGTILMVGGSMGINVLNYAYHLVMGRILGPASYGELASVFSVLYILSIVPIASSVAVVKFISAANSQKEKASIYFSLSVLIKRLGLVGCVVLLVASPAIATFLHIDNVIAVAMLGPIFYFSILATFDQAALQAVLSFLGVILSNLVSSIGKLLFGVSLIFLGFGLNGATLAILLAVIIAYTITQFFIRQSVNKLPANKYDYSQLLKYAVPAFLQALAFTSLFTTDLILVKHFFSDHDAGLYAALSTLGKVIYFASSPVSSVMFPLVSGKRSRGEAYRKIFILSFILTAALSFAAAIIYGVFPNFVVGLLYGEKYLEGAPYLVWMGMFIGVYTLCQLLVNFLLSINKVKLAVLPCIAAIVQVVFLWFIHDSLLQVIQVSLLIVTALLIVLLGYLVTREVQLRYERH